MNIFERHYTLICIVIANILMLSAGMMVGWASPVLAKLGKVGEENPLGRPITTEESSWVGSLMLLGSAFSPAILNFSSAQIGRKWTLTWLGLPLLLSFLMAAFAEDVELYYAARFISGVPVAGVLSVGSLYMAELTDKQRRGAATSTPKATTVFGMFFGYAIGPYLSVMWFSLAATLPILVFLPLAAFVLPETPFFLISVNKEKEAKETLTKLRSNKLDEDEFKEIQEVVNLNLTSSFKELFGNKLSRKALIITSVLLILQQLSGVNTVIAYAQIILETANSSISPEASPIIMGGVQVFGSLIAPIFIDRFGRKVFLIASGALMFITEATLGFYLYFPEMQSQSWLPTICLVVYLFAYSYGAGPIPWVFLAELIPRKVKDRGSAIATALCFITAFVVTKFFPTISDLIGMHGGFWFFSACNILLIMFTVIFVPETKGKSPMELETILLSKKK